MTPALRSLAARHSVLTTFLLIFFSLLLSIAASAQGPTTGTPPFGSFDGGPDIINVANLNAHLGIPILIKPGRGTPFTASLSYDTSVWTPTTSGSTTSWQPATNWGWIVPMIVSTQI